MGICSLCVSEVTANRMPHETITNQWVVWFQEDEPCYQWQSDYAAKWVRITVAKFYWVNWEAEFKETLGTMMQQFWAGGQSHGNAKLNMQRTQSVKNVDIAVIILMADHLFISDTSADGVLTHMANSLSSLMSPKLPWMFVMSISFTVYNQHVLQMWTWFGENQKEKMQCLFLYITILKICSMWSAFSIWKKQDDIF